MGEKKNSATIGKIIMKQPPMSLPPITYASQRQEDTIALPVNELI